MKDFTLSNNRKMFALLLSSFFIFGMIGANWRVEQVSAQTTIRDEYLPPYVIANLIVNISSSFFNKNIIKSSQDSVREIPIQQTTTSIRNSLTGYYTELDLELGWAYLYISLNAFTRVAKISPASLIYDEVVNSDNNSSRLFKIKKMNQEFLVPVDFPSNIVVTQQNQSQEYPNIGWENIYNEKMTLSDFLFDRKMTLKSGEFPFLNNLFKSYEQNGIGDTTLEISTGDFTSSTEANILEFELTKNLIETIFQWVSDSLGLDTSTGEQEKIKSIFAFEVLIEQFIPYDRDDTFKSSFDESFKDYKLADVYVYAQKRSQPLNRDQFTPSLVETASIMNSIKNAVRVGKADKVKSIITNVNNQTIGIYEITNITILGNNGISKSIEINSTISNGRLGSFSVIFSSLNMRMFAFLGITVLSLTFVGIMIIIKINSGRSNESI